MSLCQHPKCQPHPATATHHTHRGLLLCDRHADQWNAYRAALPLPCVSAAAAQLALSEVLEVRPTLAMMAGTQRVDQCAWCGTVVISPGNRKPSGPCPSCDHPDAGWWAQSLPLAGIHRKGLAQDPVNGAWRATA